jgi:BMFP domain-containing protein YqiC
MLRLRLRNLGFKVRIAELLMRQNNTELKARIKELEKNKADSSTNNVRCDAENAELKAKVTKLEQDSKQSQEDQEPAHIPDSIIAQLSIVSRNTKLANIKLLEEMEIDVFLDEARKKSISDEIRKCNKETFA